MSHGNEATFLRFLSHGVGASGNGEVAWISWSYDQIGSSGEPVLDRRDKARSGMK